MRPWHVWLAIASICLVSATAIAQDPPAASDLTSDTFHESLHLTPLPSGRLHSIFNFRLSSPFSHSHHSELLPASFLALLENQPLPLQELHLSFNKGRWDYQQWGSPLVKDNHGITWGSDMVANGAEVWARYQTPTDMHRSPNHHPTSHQAGVFHALLASLSGQFCSTLAATGSREAISMPSNLTASLYGADHDSVVMHLTQPPSPCTETLYPMLALLPCKTSLGLASLLEPHHWLSTEWHGIELAVKRHHHEGWTLNLVAASVFDPVRKSATKDFSMSSIFGKSLDTSCPLASQSFVRLAAPAQAAPDLQLRPPPSDLQSQVINDDIDEDDQQPSSQDDDDSVLARRAASHLQTSGQAVYDRPPSVTSSSLDISLQWPQDVNEQALRTPPSQSNLHIERSYVSTSQLNGHIVLRMTNLRPDISRRLIYREVIPWFVDLNLPAANSTLSSLPSEDQAGQSSSSYIQFTSDLTLSPVKRLAYTPSIPRHSPSTIEVEFRIPPRVQVEWTIPFDKETIRYEEHPPDAHRGLEVGVGTVWEVRGSPLDDDADDGRSATPLRVVSTYKLTPSLVEVTVPDFSMPYNVIIFTCTLLALFAGSTLNILTRRYKDLCVPVVPSDDRVGKPEAAQVRRALDRWVRENNAR